MYWETPMEFLIISRLLICPQLHWGLFTENSYRVSFYGKPKLFLIYIKLRINTLAHCPIFKFSNRRISNFFCPSRSNSPKR